MIDDLFGLKSSTMDRHLIQASFEVEPARVCLSHEQGIHGIQLAARMSDHRALLAVHVQSQELLVEGAGQVRPRIGQQCQVIGASPSPDPEIGPHVVGEGQRVPLGAVLLVNNGAAIQILRIHPRFHRDPLADGRDQGGIVSHLHPIVETVEPEAVAEYAVHAVV